LKYIKSADIV